MKEREWPTIPEVAAATGLPARHLYAWADEGRLKTYTPPTSSKQERYRVNPNHLPDFLRINFDLTETHIQRYMKALGYCFFKVVAA